jgi:hypothetical protein
VGSRSARGDRTRSLYACGAAREGQQRDVASPLDGFAEPTLMAGTNASHAAGQNLAALLHELRQDVGALIVDEVHLLDAKLADLLLAEILALAAAGTTGPARTSCAGPAFAAGTTMSTPWATVTTAGSVTTAGGVSAFAAGAAGAGALRLFLFLCHCCLPFDNCDAQPNERFK